MLKKNAGYGFLLIAYIIILAHTAIHHHHLPHQSFFVQDQTTETSNKTQQAESSNNDHDHESDNEHCILSRIIGIPTNIFRQISGDNFQEDLHSDFSGFHAVFLFVQFELKVPAVTKKLRPPLLVFSFISHTSGNLGLRAPPVI